jgi:hypothetical protein
LQLHLSLLNLKNKMATIFPASPQFDAEKFVKSTNQKLNITNSFYLYGVGITDVEEKYIDWKYTQQYKFKLFFEKFDSINIANEVYNEFVNCGYQPLETDPIDLDDCSNCKNVFIVRIP